MVFLVQLMRFFIYGQRVTECFSVPYRHRPEYKLARFAHVEDPGIIGKRNCATRRVGGKVVPPNAQPPQLAQHTPNHYQLLSMTRLQRLRGLASRYGTQTLTHEQLMTKVDILARRPQTGVSLQNLLEFGTSITPQKLIHSARLLHYEMPIRYAHRVKDLEHLPHGLSEMPSVKMVRDWYVQSVEELLAFPKVKTFEDELAFRNLIESIKNRHGKTLYTMAKGVHELKLELFRSFSKRSDFPGRNGEVRKDLGERYLRSQEFADLADLHSFLDAFYMSRIGIRMLMAQHIALHEEEEGWVGCICETTSPAEIALAAIETARHMCIRQYGDAPEVELHGHTDFSMPFVPSHLHHMLFEVIKVRLQMFILLTLPC